MRIQVGYVTRYDYEAPAKLIVQVLRMTPRGYDGLHVLKWQVDIDADARLHIDEDPFGNTVHLLSAPGPLKRLTTRVTGDVETWDTGGVVAGAVERFPTMVFLRSTSLTHIDEGLAALATEIAGANPDPLDRLHALLKTVHGAMTFDTDRTDTATTAAEAYAMGHGVCQDLAHVFIAAARALGAPARYVSGHLARGDGRVEQEASHAWAEAHVEGLGWIGFDPTNGICPTEAYVRVAVGLDYLACAPVRGSRYGGGAEHLAVKLRVTPAGH